MGTFHFAFDAPVARRMEAMIAIFMFLFASLFEKVVVKDGSL
jgi:hypothetical protein